MKSAQIVGRLSRPVEVQETTGGTPITDFDLAVDDYNHSTKEKDTAWITCKVIGSSAKFLGDYANKGDVVAIQGELKLEKYESKKYKDDEGIGAPMKRPVVVANMGGVQLFSKGNGQQTLSEAVDEDPDFFDPGAE